MRPNPGTNRAYQTGIDRPDGTLVKFTSVCAPMVYRGDRLPAELYGNVFVAEPAANLVSRIVARATTATTLRARKAYERGEFLASTDERFRPVFICRTRPTARCTSSTCIAGSSSSAISTHRVPARSDPRAQARAADRARPHLPRRARDDAARHEPRSLANASTAELVETLSHPNGWWRDTAQRLLVERGDTAAVPALTKLAGDRERTGGRGCTRCGRSTGSTPSSRRPC